MSEPVFDPADTALRFAVDGYIPQELSVGLATMSIEAREELASDLMELVDLGSQEGDMKRLHWLARSLGSPTLNNTTLIEYCSGSKQQVGYGVGLGERCLGMGSGNATWTGGRHSSSDTRSVF